jgi:hypothetical protein
MRFREARKESSVGPGFDVVPGGGDVMDESEALLDLLMVDMIALLVVVGVYLIQAKVRSLFRGFKALQTEHYMRSTLGMPKVADMIRRRSGRSSHAHGARSPIRFWMRYSSRKGLAKALYRFNLERRFFRMLRSLPKDELDKVAFSLMFWRRNDCPNHELYIARPPHHIALQDTESLANERAAEERKQRMLALKTKSEKQVLEWIRYDVRRRSSSSVQWLYDSLNRGWVGDIGATKSRAIRLTEENEARSS